MTRRWWWVVVVAGMGSVISGCAMVAVWHADQQEGARARAQWQQAPHHYHLDFTIWGDELSGAFHTEVQHQHIVSVVNSTTGQPVSMTMIQTLTTVLPIEHLFKRVDETHPSSGRIENILKRRFPEVQSVFGGLEIGQVHQCWQPSMEHVQHDEQWGYPCTLSWSSNRCDSGMFSLDNFAMEITAFQPLP